MHPGWTLSAGITAVTRRDPRATNKKIFVRSVTNFVNGDEWFYSIFKLKMSDSSKMV